MRKAENEYVLDPSYASPSEIMNVYDKIYLATDPVKSPKQKRSHLSCLLLFIVIVHTLCLIYLFSSGFLKTNKPGKNNYEDDINGMKEDITNLKHDTKNIKVSYAKNWKDFSGKIQNDIIGMEKNITNLKHDSKSVHDGLTDRLKDISNDIKNGNDNLNSYLNRLNSAIKNVQNEFTKNLTDISKKIKQGAVPQPVNNTIVKTFLHLYCAEYLQITSSGDMGAMCLDNNKT